MVSAQDVGIHAGFGAYTGEMSSQMLVDGGITWTLTGHSERRVGFGYPVRDHYCTIVLDLNRSNHHLFRESLMKLLVVRLPLPWVQE